MALPKSGVELVAENGAAYIATLEKGERATEAFDRAVASAAPSMSGAFDRIGDAAKQSGDLWQDAAGRWRTASGQFATDADKAAAGIDALPRAADEAGRKLSASENVFTGFFRSIGTAVFDMAAQAGQALADLAIDTVNIAGDFESSFNRFASVAGDLDAVGVTLDDVRARALELGKDTQFSAQEAADGMTELVKGGRDAKQSMSEVGDVLNLVAAGGLPDVATGAEIVAKQLGVWAESGVTASDVTDLLARAANASTVDVAELNDGLLQAAGTAKATGVKYDDFVTTMAAIAPAFSSAQEAGSSYRNFLVRLQPSTKEAAAAMADLSLLTEDGKSKFFDATGAFIGGEQAAELLRQKLSGLSDAQRQTALQTIFGNDAMNAAVALAEQGGEGYRNMAASMESAGSAVDQAAKLNQGFNFGMEQLKGSLETLQIVVGSAVLPVLTDVVGVFTSGANVALAFASGGDGATAALDALSTSLETISPWLSDVVDAIAHGEDPLAMFAQLLGFSSEGTSALAEQVQEIASGALQDLTRAWEKDVLPAVDEAQRFFVEDLAPILEDLATAFLPAVGAALRIGAAVWENVLVPALTMAWGFLTEHIVPILSTVADWLSKNLPPAIEATADFFTETLLPAIGDVYAFIDENVIPILEAVADVMDAVVGRAIQELAKLWETTLAPALESVGSFLSETLNPVFEDLGAWLETVTGGFDGISRAVDGVVGWLSDLADAIRNLPDLPGDLQPGSPTPFELGLRGIGHALDSVNPKIAGLSMEITALHQVTPDAGAGAGEAATSVTTSYHTSYEMPIYTNQSPSVLQDSLAVISALADMRT